MAKPMSSMYDSVPTTSDGNRGDAMKVALFKCGPAANESELLAFEHLKNRLQSTAGDDEWVLLTNLAFSVNTSSSPMKSTSSRSARPVLG